MEDKFTCIIPFYNEGKNTLTVIREVLKVKYINQVICVDDGSTDEIYKVIVKSFPRVNLIRMKQNQGKSKAVFMGLKRAVNENLILMDADLKKFNCFALNNAIKKYLKAKNLDVLIFKMPGDYEQINNFLRQNIVLSGIRIIKKTLLKQVESNNPVGYQLEAAINDFILNNHKIVKWTNGFAYLPHKMKKTSVTEGLLGDLRMDREIINYLGITRYIKQLLFFAREELK